MLARTLCTELLARIKVAPERVFVLERCVEPRALLELQLEPQGDLLRLLDLLPDGVVGDDLAFNGLPEQQHEDANGIVDVARRAPTWSRSHVFHEVAHANGGDGGR